MFTRIPQRPFDAMATREVRRAGAAAPGLTSGLALVCTLATAGAQVVNETQATKAGTYHMPPGAEPPASATPQQVFPVLIPGGDAELERIKNLPRPSVERPPAVPVRPGSEGHENQEGK